MAPPQGAEEEPRSWRLLGHADTVRALCWVEEGQPEPLLASRDEAVP